MATGTILQPVPEGKIVSVLIGTGQSAIMTTFRNNSCACIVMGFVRSEGTVMLGVILSASTTSQTVDVVDLFTGQPYTSTHISFTPVLYDSVYRLSINNINPSTVSGSHNLTVIGS